MCAKHYENPTMLSRVTTKNVGDVFLDTLYIIKVANVDAWPAECRTAGMPNHVDWHHTASWWL